MEVGRLPISATLRGKLISSGYTTLSSLASVSPSNLARELEISNNEAFEVLKLASHGRGLDRSEGSGAIVNGAETAWDMLHKEQFIPRITTSCADLDNLLGGGINVSEVTEIGGVPGIEIKRHNLFVRGNRIQLAVNVQIPGAFGGVGGKAVYIEGSFMVERALQIAEACIEDMSDYSVLLKKNAIPHQIQIEPKNILENIFYFRVCSYTEQIALINYLDKFITEHKDVKVVIVDSVTFHFRQNFDDLALRTRLLSEMALKLMKLAKKFSLAVRINHLVVVLFNQVTTKFAEGSFQLTLALGDSWSHSCTNRIILYWNGDERYAYLEKSPSLQSASAPYSVTCRGIRNSTSSNKRTKMM
ncbi:DNA repair protein RAD51 homolog 3 isoform X2 [Cucumis melo]|uniref:DNA repair protein RAD51 homolog 3 n=1 Tax=Cucumis melo TaxID=3656 RepID=A0ABM3KVU6_CUCME|nr:DNA repair protein RAD51 homolog 3 isoform X2 [Cucumis melo]